MGIEGAPGVESTIPQFGSAGGPAMEIGSDTISVGQKLGAVK
jgi:hypothetical protein